MWILCRHEEDRTERQCTHVTVQTSINKSHNIWHFSKLHPSILYGLFRLPNARQDIVYDANMGCMLQILLLFVVSQFCRQKGDSEQKSITNLHSYDNFIFSAKQTFLMHVPHLFIFSAPTFLIFTLCSL